jgi:nitrogen-specific signal transduction histidine kinase
MITALALHPEGAWTRSIVRLMPPEIMLLQAGSQREALEIAETVPISLVIMEAPELTEHNLELMARLKELCPGAAMMCLAPAEVVSEARRSGLARDEFWMPMPTDPNALHSIVSSFWDQLTQVPGEVEGAGGGHRGDEREARERYEGEQYLYQLLRSVAGARDQGQLFNALADAAEALTRCATCCLLWAGEGEREYRVRVARGLHPSLVAAARLAEYSALTAWLRKTRRVIASGWLETGENEAGRGIVERELEILGGVLAVPMFCDAQLKGVLVLGPRVVGSNHTQRDAETLYLLCSHVALAARQLELNAHLSHQKREIDLIFATMRSGLVGLNRDGLITVCNDYARELLQLGEGELGGEDLRRLPAPLGDYLYEAMVAGAVRNREEVMVRGLKVMLRISTYPLVNGSGEVTGSLGVFEDISAERELGEQRQQADRLEMLNHFVARLAHELRNPLATINTFAELLPTRSHDTEFQEFYSKEVTKDIARIAELVKKLLSLVEMPAPVPEAIAVGELLERCREALNQLAGEDGVALAVEMGSEVPAVWIDPRRTVSALVHLLHFCASRNQGELRLRASSVQSGDGQPAVELKVECSDRLDDEIARHVLDPMYALEHPEVDLGPAACQRLIESQGGRVETSVNHVSTLFRVTLPAVLPAASLNRDEAR